MEKKNIFQSSAISYRLSALFNLNIGALLKASYFVSHISYLIFISGITCFAQNTAETYAESITAQDLKRHLSIIAADSMQGRDTGSKGMQMAADYISGHFFKLGLKPIVDNDDKKSYYQYYNLYKKDWKESYILIEGKRKNFFRDFYPNGLFSTKTEQTLPLIFVGYGIEANAYSDYTNIDVNGKAVVFFDGEPIEKGGNPTNIRTFTTSEWAGSEGLKKKIALAKAKGAKHCLVISDVKGKTFEDRAVERRLMLSRFNRLSMKPFNEPSNDFATLFVSSDLGASLLGLKEKKLQKLKNSIAQTAQSQNIAEKSLTFQVDRGDIAVEAQNVLGFLEGTDKKEEVLVITAHFDHVGVDSRGQIYNGADDDGSGTCAVLEIAEAFAKAKADGFTPRRSILFMTVSGEEKGLLGSQYYTDQQPIIPLTQTVCNLNIDMIGRVDKAHAKNEKYTYIIGSDKLSSELHQISEEANKKYIGYDLDYTYNDPNDPNKFYYRSDHYNFAKNKIPVVFYFTGVHEDYHQPTDDIEKIMFPKYQQIARLVFHTAWEVANRADRIKVDSNKP